MEDKNKNSKNQEENKVPFIAGLKEEFKKIIWPSRQTLIKQTGTVIVTSLLVGVMVMGMDFVFGTAYYTLVQMLG